MTERFAAKMWTSQIKQPGYGQEKRMKNKDKVNVGGKS